MKTYVEKDDWSKLYVKYLYLAVVISGSIPLKNYSLLKLQKCGRNKSQICFTDVRTTVFSSLQWQLPNTEILFFLLVNYANFPFICAEFSSFLVIVSIIYLWGFFKKGKSFRCFVFFNFTMRSLVTNKETALRQNFISHLRRLQNSFQA